MPLLTNGARELPLRHISIRVPWNDTDWAGTVCIKPTENTSCMILKSIRASRDDQKETVLAGKSWEDLGESQYPACIGEHGNFMSPFEITRTLNHPYAKNSAAHKHMLPATLRMPAYSATAVPFSWMLREEALKKVEALDLGYTQGLEDRADELMGYCTSWVQEKANQLVMLDTFFGAIKPQKSLVFFYAKRIPFVEDTRRVLIGVGLVSNVGAWTEYNYAEEPHGELKSVLWERPIYHSIRPGFQDGFILPYQKIIKYLDEHPEEDPADFVSFVPDDQFWSFSYGSEHVTNDGAISVLLSMLKVLKKINGRIEGHWNHVENWINDRLNQLWSMRGPCPGLGSALSALSVQNGTLLAMQVEKLIASEAELKHEDPWVVIEGLMNDEEYFTDRIKYRISTTVKKAWQNRTESRKALIKLLSRFELSKDQTERFYVEESPLRTEYHEKVTDQEVLENPYILFEEDRRSYEPIYLSVIDRGLFPDETIRKQYPLPELSNITDALDKRRVRAFMIHELEKATLEGHTLLSQKTIIQNIRTSEVQPPCNLTGEIIPVVSDFLAPIINKTKINKSETAYQLAEFSNYGKIIRNSIEKRLKGKRHQTDLNWMQILTDLFNDSKLLIDEEELSARKEKAAALDELYSSRFSVLLGSAGTGKTTLLQVLCQEPSVSSGGILLLAPTGKARVQMEGQAKLHGAKTIAQFLLQHDRYDPLTGRYYLSTKDSGISSYKTVIIDESSMLTEDQLAAVIDALKGVERLILVGDDRQLPPIGAGRPFLDIVKKLSPQNRESMFPRVSKGFAELTITRRQTGQDRYDLQLSDWFSGRPLDPGADTVWATLHSGIVDDHLEFVEWDYADDLQRKLLDSIVRELNLEGIGDSNGFELSCGGSEYQNNIYFWPGKNGKPGACRKAENWEILSPIRGNAFGVEEINRLIQSNFRSKTKSWANSFKRKIPRPMGREEILYGDKVIQVRNEKRFKVYPKEDALKYVANGEIGIAVGQYKTKNMHKKPWALEIEFSTQPGYKYSYFNKDFGEEGEPVLELAYALTIHKTQGSEFDTTFVVIPNPCRLLSRELLYTALTRHTEKIIIFHQGSISDLMEYSSFEYSQCASRLTNLFKTPRIVISDDKFLEENLIHCTAKGLFVRSKSEVIVATALDNAGIDYAYENKLIADDGTFRYPDFTIDDAESGEMFIWEHLGMLSQPKYKRRWDEKLAWYKTHGILPLKDGGGSAGTLITTRDQPNGGIDVQTIEECITRIQKGR